MKKFLTVLLTFCLCMLLLVLGISLCFKSIFMDTIESVMIKNDMADEISDSLYEQYGINANEITSRIENDDDINRVMSEVIMKYIDQLAEDISSSEEVSNYDIRKDIVAIIRDNRDVFKKYGTEIDDADIERVISDLEDNEEINSVYREVVMNYKNEMTDGQRQLINIYNVISSTKFMMIVICIIVVSLLLIGIVKKSFYKWLFNISLSSILCGIAFGVILPLGIELIYESIRETFVLDGVIVFDSLYRYGYFLIVIGIICGVIYLIIRNTRARKVV